MNNDDNIIYQFPKQKTCLSKLKKCLKYFYCNQKETTSKKYYITKWRKYLSKEVHTEKELNDPFALLTRLWAHKNVIHELEDIRLNPNLLNKKQIRNDLEFYIPQLCSFMIFGEYEIVQELFSFLCKSCFVSFSFAHRIIWFIKSSINQDPQFSDRIRKMLSIIQTIFKSDKDKDTIEDLFLSGSKEYIEYFDKRLLKREYLCNNTALISEKESEEQSEKTKSFLLSKANFRRILNNYIEYQYSKELNKDKEITQQQQQDEIIDQFEVNPQDIYLTLYERYDFVTNDEDSVHIQFTKQIDTTDVNLSSFLSNINFIDRLCNISDILMYTDQSQQKKTLISELKKVNKVLPSNVYLPFINKSMRNYVVSSIPISEARIFRTKTRAPYMITVECFRLDEVTYNLTYNNPNNNINSNSNNISVVDNDGIYSNSMIETEIEINKKGLEIPLNLTQDSKEINTHCKSSTNNKSKEVNPLYAVNHLKNKSDFFVEKIDKKSKKFKTESYENVPKSSNNEYQIDNNNDKNDINIKSLDIYLLENEVKFSKPIIIRNLIKRTGSSSFDSKSSPSSKSGKGSSSTKGEKKIKFDYNTITTTEIEAYPNDLITANIISTTPQADNNASLKCEQIDNTIKNKFNTQIELNMDNVLLNKDDIVNDNVFISKTPRMRSIDITLSSLSSPKGQHSLSDEQDDSKSDEEKEKDKDSSGENNTNNNSNNIYSLQLDTQGNEYDKNQIFGETMEQKTERLRKVSPFGKLLTYKLFNVIVKSGEDLRQEQFATQLISEFFQIFKFEKVQCWLQPYEIIATGTDVGLVEVVPNNAISLDQLKHRAKTVNTLQEFYNTYYGPIGSPQHKAAMKNYIQSLAGYSLVCYFLQIKDRHNANILIDDKGHLVHIDFGYMLSNSPGKGIKFEKAPFKLTQEFVDVMGGTNSTYFDKYRKLLWKGFIALSQHYEKILILVEMMYCGHGNNLPCFEKGADCILELRSRFVPKPDMKKRDYIAHVDLLISQSLGNWTTKWYDKYQYYVQGILA